MPGFANTVLHSLIDGKKTPDEGAELARGSLHGKLEELRRALRGHFTEHLRDLLQHLLEHLRQLEEQIDDLTRRIQERIHPFLPLPLEHHLDAVPGVAQANPTTRTHTVANTLVCPTIFSVSPIPPKAQWIFGAEIRTPGPGSRSRFPTFRNRCPSPQCRDLSGRNLVCPDVNRRNPLAPLVAHTPRNRCAEADVTLTSRSLARSRPTAKVSKPSEGI